MFVVLTAPVPDRVFHVALALGAESVAELPRSEGWLVERLTDVVDSGPARGLTIGVVGGSGGSGATTFACALAQVAGRAGPSVVVDADPLGPGVDRVLGPRPGRRRPVGRARPHDRAAQRAAPCATRCRDATASPPSTWYAGPQPRHTPGVRRARGPVGGPPRPRHRGGRPAARAATRWPTRS